MKKLITILTPAPALVAALALAACGSSIPASNSSSSASRAATSARATTTRTVTQAPRSPDWRAQLDAIDCRYKPQLQVLSAQLAKLGADSTVAQFSSVDDQARNVIGQAIMKFNNVQVPAAKQASVGRWLGELYGEQAALQSVETDVNNSDTSAAKTDAAAISSASNVAQADRIKLGVGCST